MLWQENIGIKYIKINFYDKSKKKEALVVVASIKDAVLRQTLLHVRTQEPGKQCHCWCGVENYS